MWLSGMHGEVDRNSRDLIKVGSSKVDCNDGDDDLAECHVLPQIQTDNTNYGERTTAFMQNRLCHDLICRENV